MSPSPTLPRWIAIVGSAAALAACNNGATKPPAEPPPGDAAACADGLEAALAAPAGQRLTIAAAACATACRPSAVLLDIPAETAAAERLPFRHALTAAVKACAGFCSAKAELAFDNDLHETIWRDLDAACPQTFALAAAARPYLGTRWFAIGALAANVASLRSQAAAPIATRLDAARARFAVPLPPVAERGGVFPLPTAAAIHGGAPLVFIALRADVTAGDADAAPTHFGVGALPWAGLGDDGRAALTPTTGKVFPGTDVTAATLPTEIARLTAEQRDRGLDAGVALPGPLLLAPHRMPARHVLAALRALAGAQAFLAVDGEPPRGHLVALAWGPGVVVDGLLADPASHELHLAADATVADLAAALDDAAHRDRPVLYVGGAPGAIIRNK